jgi:hypothetical protein
MTDQDPTRFDPREDELAERGRLLVSGAVAATRAPHALRERLEADRERLAPVARRRRGWWLAGGLATAAATIAVAIVLGVAGGGGGTAGPTVLAVASLTARGPAQPAPAEDSGHPMWLRRNVEGVAFPYWSDRFPWKAAGARSDRVAGRPTATVFYDGPRGARLGYSIVAGHSLPRPEGAQATDVGRTRLWTVRRGDRTIVTWQRAGHTCVISAPSTVPVERVQALAAWNAND